MAMHVGEDSEKPLTMDDLQRIKEAAAAYAQRRSEVAPPAFEGIGAEDEGWSNATLAALGQKRERDVIGRFLEGIFDGIEMEKIDTRIPATAQRGNFLALCAQAGCCDRSLEDFRRTRVPELYPIPTSRRCCILRSRGGLMAFSQYELCVRARGLRFARPEDLLGLAIAAPHRRFQRCYAVGTIADGARSDVRVYWLGDCGTETKPLRIAYAVPLPHVWTSDMSLLAIKDD